MASNMFLLLRQANKQFIVIRNLEKFNRVFYHQNLNITSYENGFKLNAVKAMGVVPCRAMGKDARKATARNLSSDSESDSDSDKEKERGSSDFWRLKMRTLHALLDLNKDGVVSWDDFRMLGDRFIELGHLSEKQQEEFRKTLKSVWEEQWGPADPYNMVNAYQYLDNMHHVLNDKNLKRKAHRFLPYLFKAVDKDKSGEISVEEFKLFFKCLGLKEEEAVAAFRAIDINHDNCLSQKEFVKYGRQYFTTEDERKPSRCFWGPLLADH